MFHQATQDMPQMFDASFLFGESSVDPEGRECAEKLKVLLEKHVHLGTSCLTKKQPHIFLPEDKYLTDESLHEFTKLAVKRSRLVFVILSAQLCTATKHVLQIADMFSDIFPDLKKKRALVPIYVSYRTDLPSSTFPIPFDLENVVGINISEIAGSRTLMEVNPTRIRSRDLDKMCLQKFSELLNNKSRRLRKLTPQDEQRRQVLYKLARETLAKLRDNEQDKCVAAFF